MHMQVSLGARAQAIEIAGLKRSLKRWTHTGSLASGARHCNRLTHGTWPGIPSPSPAVCGPIRLPSGYGHDVNHAGPRPRFVLALRYGQFSQVDGLVGG